MTKKQLEAQRVAREAVMVAGRKRAAAVRALARATEELIETAVEADRAKLKRSEIAEHARVDRNTVYGWLRAARRPMSERHGGAR